MGVDKLPVQIAACVLTLVLTACALSPSSRDQELLDTLKMDLAFQYHECVPLGWAPVRVMNSYYPGYSAGLQSYALWLDAMWIGSVRNSELKRPEVATVVNVLNHLVHAGLLVRKPTPGGSHYYMTLQASHYFYEANAYRNNPDWIRYLCYSTVTPDKIVRIGPIRTERHGQRTIRAFRVTFEWKTAQVASWANDPYLRAHSVILAPLHSPTTGNMVYVDGAWDLASLDNHEPALPELVDPSAWPAPISKASLSSRS